MKAPPVRADQAPTSVVPDTCKRAVTKVDCHGLTRSERSRDPLIPQNQAIELCPHVVAWQTQSVLAAADLMGRPVRQWCEARVKHRDAVRDNEKSGLRALLKHPADAFSVHRLDFGKTPVKAWERPAKQIVSRREIELMNGKVRIGQVLAKCVAFGLQLFGGRALLGQLVDDLEHVRPNCAKLFDQPIGPEKEVVAIEIESFEFCRDLVGQT